MKILNGTLGAESSRINSNPRLRRPVPPSMMSTQPSDSRTCRQLVFPPRRRNSACGVGMEPRTPQNFSSIRNRSLIVSPLRRGGALVGCGQAKHVHYIMVGLHRRGSATRVEDRSLPVTARNGASAAVDREVTLNAAQQIERLR